MIVTRHTFRRSVYLTLILSVIGLALVCLSMAGLETTGEFASSWFPQIAAGYAAMILIIERLGIPHRSKLTRFPVGALFGLGLFGLGLFVAGVLAGSATSMAIYRDFDPFSYIVKPLYWLGRYGLIPALFIGLIGTAILRSASKKSV